MKIIIIAAWDKNMNVEYVIMKNQEHSFANLKG